MVGRILRSPHFVNMSLLTLVCVSPIMYYASTSTPKPEELEGTLHSQYGKSLDRSRSNSAHIGAFIGSQGAMGGNMDAVCADLLKGGRHKIKRHHELTGALANVTATQGTEEEKRQLAVSQPLTAVALEVPDLPLAPPPPPQPPAQGGGSGVGAK